MLSILLIVLGGLLILAGVVFSILPPVPGPPLAWLALLCLQAAREERVFSPLFLLLTAGAVVVVTVLDYVVPAVGAKRYGASRLGVVGSLAGMVAGMFFLPPLGVLLGALGGALAGELLAGKPPLPALRASWGVFVGTVAGIVLKLTVCVVIGVYYFTSI